MKHFIWIICIALLGISACKTVKPAVKPAVEPTVEPAVQPAVKPAVEQPFGLTETYWRLVELNGDAIVKEPSATKEAHIILKKAGLTINGNSGCNSFFGSYTLKGKHEIHFGKMGSTMMACKDMLMERKFLYAITNADHYTIKDGRLILSKGTTTILAKFESRELR
jgi:heat shock protein HslJ